MYHVISTRCKTVRQNIVLASSQMQNKLSKSPEVIATRKIRTPPFWDTPRRLKLNLT